MSDFLKDLGQSARSKDEVKREAEQKHSDAISDRIKGIVEKIKREISDKARSGKFTTVNGRKKITGSYTTYEGVAVWTSYVFMREEAGGNAAFKLFAGLCTCGLALFILADEDDHMVYSGYVRLTSDAQRIIQDTKKELASEGLTVTAVEIGGESFWNAVTNPDDEIPFKAKNDRFWKKDYKKGKSINLAIKFTYTVTF